MKNLLIAAGNYDIVHQVKQSLNGSYYELHTAYSHRDTLFMLRSQPMDAVVIDCAMFDRTSGEKTLVTLSRLVSAPTMIAYAPTASAVSSAQSLLGRASVTYIEKLDKLALVKGLSEALNTALPTFESDDSKFDTSPKEQTLWRDDEIQTLFALSRSLTEVLDINEVLHRVVQAGRHLTDADEGILLMPDRETGQFYLRAEVGVETEMVQTFRVRLNDSFAGEVFNSGEPLLVGPGAGPHKIKTQYFVNSLLYVPISLKGERIGVLGVNNRRKKAVFNRRHQELLIHLASYAAIAIENARVHGMSIQRAQDLTALVGASHVINSSLSLEATLIHIAQQLHALLNGGRIDIYQWKKEKRTTPEGEIHIRTPMLVARYRRAVWRVSYAPALALKSRPALVAALRNKVVTVTTARQELPEEVEYLRQVGAHAVLSIPIMVEKQPLGLVLAYYTAEPGVVPTEVIQRAQAIGVELLSLQLDSNDTQHAHIYKNAEDVKKLLGASWVEFTLLGQDRRSLLVLITIGESVWLQRPFEEPVLLGFSDMLQMLVEQNPVWASANGDTSTLGSLSVLDAVNGRSMLGLPMIAQGEPLGFMLVIDTERTRTFTEREINMAKAVISQGTTAMKNADLMRRLELSYQELKMAQDRLIRAARLSAKGELAGAVAHQVNNPLTTIVLDAELLLLNPSLNERAKESLNAILRSGKKAAAVVRRLLTTTQTEQPTKPERIPVIETIDESLGVIRSHVQREGITVLSRVDVYDTPFVMATRDELNDLWLNLLLNAHDALNGRAKAELGVDVRFQPGDNAVEVVVWDNGLGIADDVIDRIFDPFFTTKPMDERTGLGLHICRQIIDRLGGNVRVNSNGASGTQFIIRLPIVKE